MGTLDKIREKLDKEEKGGKFDRYASVMKKYIKEALLTLCGQSERFAAAVLDGDTFEDCMKAVAEGDTVTEGREIRQGGEVLHEGGRRQLSDGDPGAGAADRERKRPSRNGWRARSAVTARKGKEGGDHRSVRVLLGERHAGDLQAHQGGAVAGTV